VLLAVVFSRRPDRAIGALGFIVGFILFAATVVLWSLSVPRPSPVRRIVGIAADNAAITYAMLAMGEPAAVVFGAYLFVAFGNGFRYGRAYLSLSQVLALVGFGLVLSVSNFWQKNLTVGMGLLVMLIILPFYVGALAEHLRARHLKTEQALKECLERE
jgi:two-component system, sensor histidine kinase RpfC